MWLVPTPASAASAPRHDDTPSNIFSGSSLMTLLTAGGPRRPALAGQGRGHLANKFGRARTGPHRPAHPTGAAQFSERGTAGLGPSGTQGKFTDVRRWPRSLTWPLRLPEQTFDSSRLPPLRGKRSAACEGPGPRPTPFPRGEHSGRRRLGSKAAAARDTRSLQSADESWPAPSLIEINNGRATFHSQVGQAERSFRGEAAGDGPEGHAP